MSAAEWTPGPWWAAERAPKHLGSVIAIMATQGTEVATGVAHAWTEADAALIAAAPDLVEALRLTRDNLRTLNAARMDRGIVPFDPWLAVVEAALSRAGVTP